MTYLTLGKPLTPDTCGERLDVYLTQKFPFLNRSRWQERVITRKILVNSRPRKPAYRLKAGDRITFSYPVPATRAEISTIYHDPYFSAVCKPSGIPCQPNSYHRLHNLKNITQRELGRIPIHRLDLETSGIIICAADRRVIKKFGLLFQHRKIRKEYLAIVDKVPCQRQWQVNAPVGDLTTSAIRIKKWVTPQGKEAITEFETLAVGRDAALVKAMPQTGRTNQIRIHLSHCGHRILGDKLYHPDEQVFLEHFVHGLTPAVLAEIRHPRLCLHSSRLTFIHPVTSDKVDLVCSLPQELCQFLYSLNIVAALPPMPESAENQPWVEGIDARRYV